MATSKSKSILMMSHTELYQHVRAMAKIDEKVSLSSHAKLVRMLQRGVTRADILKVLRTGTMRRRAEPGDNHGELKCRFAGKDIDGEALEVEVLTSDARPNLLVITVIKPGKK